MPDPTLTLEWQGNVAIVRLNDPASLNAITLETVTLFHRAVDWLEPQARAMIVTGAGRAFCSGANLAGGVTEPGPDESYDAGLVLETHINPLMDRLRGLGLPWITAVRGAAAGAGASLALAGDLILASETAYFLQAFPRVGLVPDAGSSHLLVRTIGRPRAMELMLLGEKLPAAQALSWGLINRVVPDAQLEAEALGLAERLAGGAWSLRSIRQLAWRAVDEPWSDVLRVERELQRGAGRSADHREGVAAFLAKRPASFVGA